jgi:hypothetical protein
MAVDPRKFLVADCPVDQKGQSNNAATKRNFFSALGKIGDLNALNDVGAGSIGQGLRTLTHVSNAIRTGQSVVPGREGNDIFNSTLGRIANTAANAVNNGANIVLDTVGLGGAFDKVAGSFNPGVANNAYGAAKQVFEKVKQGNFKSTDIPGAFQDLQNLEILAKGIFTPSQTAEAKAIQGCVSPYAADLIKFAPKNKFMFIVQFTYSPAYQGWKQLGNDFAFIVKTSGRPNIEFEYEEVNMYNFRTRIPKRTVYQPITMSFYDDNQNNANLFYTSYLRAISPQANMGNGSIPTVEMYEEASMSTEQVSGTTFGNGPSITVGGGSLGALNDNTKNILSEIRLFHIFDYGKLMNIYHFYHPKILNMNLDDLNMAETGQGNEFSLEFAYDALYVEPNYDVKNTVTYNITDLTGGNNAQYPIRPVFSDQPSSEDGTANAPSSQNMNMIAEELPDIIVRG